MKVSFISTYLNLIENLWEMVKNSFMADEKSVQNC